MRLEWVRSIAFGSGEKMAQRVTHCCWCALPITDRAEDYPPGDVVAWDLDGKGMTHIGIVVDAPSATPGRYLIMHNIGAGPQLQDVLFSWRIVGHYRYPKPAPTKPPAEARPSGRV